ncbi:MULTISPECIES: acyl carrier protein [Caballeronia]|uniref:Acyl carrier protein n=1 Tax=Caballeronia jiangsuensis TaxID=1458357 RepID=A0ABW9CW45_9BURK|nr:acyl carrier protein [Caballeronia sp. GaOx3]
MNEFNLHALVKFMRDSGEQDESSQAELSEANANLTFGELGFDSLSLLNLIEQIKHKHGLAIAYDEAVSVQTPEALLTLIQQSMPTEK